MPAIRRLAISLKRDYALKATRITIGRTKLVYVLVADKRMNYPKGQSRIVYVGTTRNGTQRVAGSVATRSEQILSRRGVRSFEARIITCRPRQSVRTWRKLERALLLQFRHKFGDIPLCNIQGQNIREMDEFRYFSRARIRGIVDDLS